MISVTGRRLPDVEVGYLPDSKDYLGAYWRDTAGTWWCGVPEQGFGVGRLSRHQVVEHEDGTITVSPSILIQAGPDRSWHGYLERGEWRKI